MIIQIITNLYPLPWEPNRSAFNRQQFENLAADNEVHVIVLVPWMTALKHVRELRGTCINKVKVEYLPYTYLPGMGRRLYPAFVFFSLLFKLLAISKRRPDCMLLSWAYPDAVAGMMVSRLLKVPALIKVHGSDINMHGAYPSRASQIKWAMEKAVAVLSVSRDLKDKITQMGVSPGKIHVIYNGVDKQLFHPQEQARAREKLGLNRERKIILYIGNLKRSKGCVDLFDAFRLIAGSLPHLDMYYIGGGDQAESIARLARENGLEGRVNLAGSISHDKLGDWINASDLVALPSHNEGVPNVLLEAMSCGVPVVATRVGGIPEVVADNAGILVKVSDSEALSAALKEALSREWDREQIRSTMQQFSWQYNTQQLQELLTTTSRAE